MSEEQKNEEQKTEVDQPKDKSISFDDKELAAVLSAMNVSKIHDNQAHVRTFPNKELPTVSGVYKKLEVFEEVETDGGRKIRPGNHEVSFDTREKALIIKCLEDREWPGGNASAVTTLLEKLK